MASKKPGKITIPKPNAMAARFALAHRFKDKKKDASRKACRKGNYNV